MSCMRAFFLTLHENQLCPRTLSQFADAAGRGCALVHTCAYGQWVCLCFYWTFAADHREALTSKLLPSTIMTLAVSVCLCIKTYMSICVFVLLVFIVWGKLNLVLEGSRCKLNGRGD